MHWQKQTLQQNLESQQSLRAAVNFLTDQLQRQDEQEVMSSDSGQKSCMIMGFETLEAQQSEDCNSWLEPLLENQLETPTAQVPSDGQKNQIQSENE